MLNRMVPYIMMLMMMFVAKNAYSQPVAIINIQETVLQSKLGKKAKDIVSSIVLEKEKIKNDKEKELHQLKAEKNPNFFAKLDEYKQFLKGAQDEVQAVNDKLTQYVVDAIVSVTLNYYKNEYNVICISDIADKKCSDAISGTKVPVLDNEVMTNLNKQVLARLDSESMYCDSLLFKAPYIVLSNSLGM